MAFLEASEILEFELLQRIEQANEILSKISAIKVDGVSKLKNKTNQELIFLRKIRKAGNFKKDHLTCSNLKHLEAVASELIRNESSCVGVMTSKTLTEEEGSVKKLCVDLLLHGGHVWVKIVARNPKALTLVSAGEGYYGQKSIVEQADQFIRCSQQHVHFYRHPVVVFIFACGIENALAVELEELGVVVQGPRLDPDADCSRVQGLTLDPDADCSRFESGSESETLSDSCRLMTLAPNRNVLDVPSHVSNTRVNLCVSTMIAYVSALTNGGADHKFDSSVLNQHARWERERPVKPVLDQLFQGRELYCCETAVNNFRDILTTLGGPGEQKRGEELLDRLTIVEDRVSDKLKMNGRVKFRSLAIFGTGEALEAVTATANHAFIRSALNKGVNFAVFLHESRALTEGKQLDVELVD